MEWLTDLVGLYFERRLGPTRTRPTLEDVRADELLQILWPALDLFRDKMALIDSASTEGFENDADRALLTLVENDGFDAWKDFPIGAWAILLERLIWTVATATLSMGEDNAVMIRLPRGLDEDERRQACVLFFLLGPGREVPEKWKRESRRGKLEELLAASPPRL